MTMRESTDFHSRFDAPQAPHRKGLWAWLGFQLHRQMLLTFYPHPDSFFYPSRLRLLLTAALLCVGGLVLGAFWLPVLRKAPVLEWGLYGLSLVAALSFCKVYFRQLPVLPNTVLYPILLWFALPLYYFLGYFLLGSGLPMVEHLVVFLFLYTNLLHWRVAGLGVLLAALVAYVAHCYAASAPVWQPGWMDVGAISVAYVGGLASSYSFAQADSQRYAQNVQILRSLGRRLNGALGVQLALSEALRHEAQIAGVDDAKAYLLELAEKLDLRANLTRAELQEMEKESACIAQVGATQLLRLPQIMPSVDQELQRAYGLAPDWMQDRLLLDGDAQVLVQGEMAEVVQMLASVLALMLRGERRLQLLSRHFEHSNVVHIGLQAGAGGRESAQTDWSVLDGLAASRGAGKLGRQDALHQSLAEQLLPDYSMYVLKKMGARLRLGPLEQGSPRSVTLILPCPELFPSGLNWQQRPLSLMALYENRLY